MEFRWFPADESQDHSHTLQCWPTWLYLSSAGKYYARLWSLKGEERGDHAGPSQTKTDWLYSEPVPSVMLNDGIVKICFRDGSSFVHWRRCCGWCLWLKPTKFAHSSLLSSCVCFCLYGPFNCISFLKLSRQLSAFSLCSFGLISAILVLSTVHLFMKVFFSPDIILSAWLGWKHQPTN